MTKWTDEATEYFEGYLKQVSALAKQQGGDAEAIVRNLRDRVHREAESSAAISIDVPTLLNLLATEGTPENIVGGTIPTGASPASTSPVPPPPPTVIVKQQSSTSGCIIAAVVVPVVALFLIAILGMVAAIMLPALARAREAARRSACQNNLKQVGITLKMYAGENEGAYPPLSEEYGRIMFQPESMYPGYLSDLSVFECPSQLTDPHAEDHADIDDNTYFYLPFVITGEEDISLFVRGYKAIHQEIPGTAITLPLVRDTLGPDAPPASMIPILVERPDHHIPMGGNVLYLDGHVEYIRFDEKFPMTAEFFDALESIDRPMPASPHNSQVP